MRAPRADALSSFQADRLLAFTRDMLEDTDLAVSVTLRSEADGTYNVATGLYTGTTDTDYTVHGIYGDYSASEIGGPVQRGDRKLLVSAQELADAGLSGAPDTSMRIIDGSTTLEIVSVRQNRVADQVLSYALQVRRLA